MKLKMSLLVWIALLSPWVSAHDGGHASGLWLSLWHLFTEPDHWLLLAQLAIIAVGLTIVWKRRVKRIDQQTESK